ncbi:Alanine dehydrogenase/pyridine nucleotide transhydrogenase, N-terminal [Dillenia turbinata]|uniref:Alanine dehydrogenase/pyridine nucleotide transhydrogenase, N-terminal n=1 Tax=Dillenia turbinata TaxID=194707 RepID=A0AAN8VI29_9MAGN
MLGNGVVGILSEDSNKWERRTPLTPSHCARLLHSGTAGTGVTRIIVQPSTKRIYHDALYEDVGCEIANDLSECGLILGVKQPKLEMILPDRAYAFFSHTHKAQKENMPLLDKILAERVSLYDYELIVGDHGKRLLAFGKYAGLAGMIDILSGLGKRFLNMGYSTPFLSLGSAYMYSSLVAAKAAVISVGEEIATLGLPAELCPLIFVFTGSGNVSLGAQEIFKLLPHTFVDPSKLSTIRDAAPPTQRSKRVFQLCGCIVSCQDMVEHKDPTKAFDKVDYYAYPERYRPVFHERIAPYASVIVNCMYWEKRFPRLLSTKQLVEIIKRGCPLIGISDITCDVGGSLEFVSRTTSIDSPFLRYDPLTDSYHHDLEGNGIIFSAVDILPTELSKEASKHFGDVLSQFVCSLASAKDFTALPTHLSRACIAHKGALTSLYEYIPRIQNSRSEDFGANLENGLANKKKYNTLVSLSGHLFDQRLINRALDIIEDAGGSFQLVKCQVGQSANALSYSELEVGADDPVVLDQIIHSLTDKIAFEVGQIREISPKRNHELYGGKNRISILILGAGRVCRPAAELLSSVGNKCTQWFKSCAIGDFEEKNEVHVVVASLYLKDAQEVVDGIPNATAIKLDAMDQAALHKHISEVAVVISLLPPSFHIVIANACIQLKKHLVTASYVDDSMSTLGVKAKSAGVTILGEMGLDPGIDHMMAMKMVNEAHARNGRIRSFTSYCGGLPSPAAANNPLAYKFSWNPAGAIKTGRNPATYRSHGEIIHVTGDNLYDSAVRLRIPHLPAFALECLPNRNSLVYGELYGIEHEASTIFRGTLRYEGFSRIMGALARLGLFNTEAHPMLKCEKMPSFRKFLLELLKIRSEHSHGTMIAEDIIKRVIELGLCDEQETAAKMARCVVFLGLLDERDIPVSCQSAFDVTCLCMEERLAYSGDEQDMVLLYHKVEVEFPDGQPTENHEATLLEFGRTENGKTTTAMALTVGIPAAIGALLILAKKINTRGVLRPIEPEVYEAALDILQAYGFKLLETVH